ncbi:MAG: hypothetical protein ACRC5R_01220 [Mycoplasmatales bacterium]
MLKTLKYSTLAVMLVSVNLIIIDVLKLIGAGISQSSLDAINLISILFPKYQAHIDQLLNISSDVKMIIIGVVIAILVVFMLSSIIGCIINYILASKQTKKTITIGKMLIIILIDLAVAFFIFSSKASWLLSNLNTINIGAVILGFLFIAHAIFATIVLTKFIKDNVKEDFLKVQLQNVYKYSVRIIAIILIIYFFQKIAFILIMNAVVDTMLRSIDISSIASGIILGGIDFSKSLSEILPSNLIDFAVQLNLPVSVSLDSFGITQQTVETLLSVSVYSPLNDAIFNFLNGFTNSFIFKNFVYLFIGFSGSIAILSINILKIPKVIVKQISLVAIELILVVVVLFFINNLLIILLLFLILTYDIIMLVYSVRHK